MQFINLYNYFYVGYDLNILQELPFPEGLRHQRAEDILQLLLVRFRTLYCCLQADTVPDSY